MGDDTELIEKLGGKDPCPCGSGRRFPPVLPSRGSLRRHNGPLLRP
ncbi:SEC-C metal-binding domain-containing protein [Nocardia sp. NPDC058058]